MDKLTYTEYLIADLKYSHSKILTEKKFEIESRKEFLSSRQIIEHVNNKTTNKKI
jgi:hypothetical protein